MNVRRAESQDWGEIFALHRSANYGYELPAEDTLYGLHVVEQDGQILAACGARPVSEIIAVLDVSLPPHRRVEAIRSLIEPVGREVVKSGAQAGYVFTDPQFRNFDRRLMRMGFSKKLWPCLFLEAAEFKKAFR